MGRLWVASAVPLPCYARWQLQRSTWCELRKEKNWLAEDRRAGERERGSSEQKRVRENVAQIRGSWVRRTSWEKGCLSEKVPQWRSSSFIIASSSTAQGGGGSFKNRKPIGEVGCCESGMAKRIHWWTERCLRSPLCLSLSLTIYLPIYLSSVYLSLSLAIYLSLSLFHLVTYLPIYLLSNYLTNYLSIYLSLSLSSVYLCSCLPIYLSIYLSVYLSVYLSICLSVYLSICGAVSFSVL